MKPLLSIVIPARNDYYIDNYNWRLETTLNFRAAELDKPGRLKDVEVVVNWWDEAPLHSVLSLTKQVKQIAQFVLIPANYPYLLVPADGLMMYNELCFESHALKEMHNHWGWSDCDIILKVRLKYFVVNVIGEKDLFVYHLNHISPENPIQVSRRKINPCFFNPCTVNNENWGLGDYQFEEFPSIAPSDVRGSSVKKVPEIEKNFITRHLLNLIFFFKNMSVQKLKYIFVWLINIFVTISRWSMQKNYKISIIDIQ